ncbi:4568_t:CDS:2 [Acaulospora morrowiae]|uniref:4568_t:CDS:1 n=1 Tax=Acaulospora morrowiae TaxID=94023 RepID=A0A9N8ZN06_9GLOM|nr:4568_t:CDS:2 [Acaulospora morrowiae]
MHYGKAEITMKCIGVGGVVNAFITMATNGDEIDWEMVGKDVSHGQTNFFWNNDMLYGVNSRTHSVPGGSINTTYHTYGIDWTPDSLTWSIDGAPVRTLYRKDTLEDGIYKYPSHPSYIQFGVWDGSGSPSLASWTNGPIDWNEQPSVLTNVISKIKITCDSTYNKVVS